MIIELTKGYQAIIDDEDLPLVAGYKWYYNKSKMKMGYAIATKRFEIGGKRKGIRRKRQVVKMHTLILPPPPGLEVDHRDGNGLNNQKSNLRYATRSQQCMNRAPQGKSSRYKGVRFWKVQMKWQARIRINRKEVHLGYFSDEVDAAKAYNRAAAAAHGDFARLNEV